MIIRLEIPQDLQRYFEFIPEEDLPQVCISALRDKVFSEERSKSSSSEINIEELVSLLSKTNTSSVEKKLEETVYSSGESSPKNIQKSERVVTKVEPIVFDDDDDLDDFMGLMK